MSGGLRTTLYAVLGLVLLVAFDPRTWGGEVGTRHGDELGLLLGAQWLEGFLTAMVVLAVVIVAVETTRRARAARRAGSSTRSEDTDRSWYE